MNVDIIVTISNYVTTDTYTVNIYRQGSVIPVVAAAVARSAGPVVTFKDLPGGYIYEAEVVRYCTGGLISSKRITVSQVSSPVCSCQTGYTANSDGTKCIRTTTVAATITIAYNVGAGPDEAAYCREGIRIYGGGFTIDGRGTIDWASGNTNPYWSSLNTTTNGRLNIAGVWNSDDNSLPINTWIGFSKTINVGTSKVYYVAVAGDNYCRIKINGVLIVDQSQNTIDDVNINFNYWHCYPVFLNAGVNIIEMEGMNTSSIGCFAAEIYNCTLDAIKGVTTGTEGTLGRLFSTGDESAFSSYTCNDGYALDLTDSTNPACRKIEYASCQ